MFVQRGAAHAARLSHSRSKSSRLFATAAFDDKGIRGGGVRAPTLFRSPSLLAMGALVARLPISAARSRAVSCAIAVDRCWTFPTACAHAFDIAAGSCWILPAGKTEDAGAWADRFWAALMSSLPDTSRCSEGVGLWADKFGVALMPSRPNTSLCSVSPQSKHCSVRYSNPETNVRSPGATPIERISPPHARHRITHAPALN